MKKRRRAPGSGPGPVFNHAMIYVRDVGRALEFYEGTLGFRRIENFGGYARLRTPGGSTTLALHKLGEDVHSTESPGVRLYFEVKQLRRFCARLARRGVAFKQKPKHMPWGWDHAYLYDPDGHEVSLYWAGAKRLRKTVF
jgi:catechol 2,3-dioxygenase-like lactoylglutathione lyase family enzyme